jgi:hypothetical protein
MIKEEAYNMMSQGYMVTHEKFKPNDYLYMDQQFIIRNQDGTTFENDWDVLISPEWNTGWYIYKGKFNVGVGIPMIKSMEKTDVSKLPMYDMGLAKLDDNNAKTEIKESAWLDSEGNIVVRQEHVTPEHYSSDTEKIRDEYIRRSKFIYNSIYSLIRLSICIVVFSIVDVILMLSGHDAFCILGADISAMAILLLERVMNKLIKGRKEK